MTTRPTTSHPPTHAAPQLAPDRRSDITVEPALLDRVTAEVEAVTDAEVAAMFRATMADNLAGVTERLEDGTVFVLTGDIPAMWLRDSATQVRPYLLLAAEDPALADALVGILHRQLEYIVADPYANSFRLPDQPSWHADDVTDKAPEIWERKYEIDSLCFPIELAHRLWRLTGRDDVIDHRFVPAARAVLRLWTTELDHAQSPYRFQRFDGPPTDTLVNEGHGPDCAPTGMSWSGFRPSDDATRYPYNVPGNMFAVVCLGYLAEIADEVLGDEALAAEARQLEATMIDGIETHGRVAVPGPDGVAAEVYCYETDGLGQFVIMDDANMPSLLSLPLSGYRPIDDPTYLRTRALLLGPDNPYFYRGTAAEGLGSPHTPERYVWPIALAVQGLTSTSTDEKRRLVELLKSTTAGTGLMHESFDVDDPTAFTRPWFSWANAMFCELVLDLAGRSFARSAGGSEPLTGSAATSTEGG